VDVRLSPEQAALRDSAAQVVDRLGPKTVAALDEAERASKLDAAMDAAGWRELRSPNDDGRPWASAVEVALVAEELGRGLADAAFLGPTLAADLRRRCGAPAAGAPETVALTADLSALARAVGDALAPGAVAIDAHGAAGALGLLPATGGDSGPRVGALALGAGEPGGIDLTRPSLACPAGVPLGPLGPLGALEGQTRFLSPDELARWHALGLAAACGDLVGVMRGALDLAVDYARARRQYDATIGSFQAVQHMLADALTCMEGARSIALHAAWAVDALEGDDALAAASAAKAYCTRAARGVCETAIQVHGGIGNTWECLAHVFLRRALLSGEILGGIGASLARVLAARGIGDGGGDGDGLR
jgi:alkylation response protein AidB-like acyl-CoA dehydrogenase